LCCPLFWISATIEISKPSFHFVACFSFLSRMSKTFDSLDDFRFEAGVTPFSSFWIPCVTCVLYFTLTRVFKLLVSNRKPLRSPSLLFFYNGCLSFFSFILFLALGAVIFEKSKLYTPHELVCGSATHQDGRLQFIYWLNYLFKYVELLDTFLLVARKKPVTFLHEYHHAATLVLCWIQQREYSTVQWVPILLNLGVHVIMYYYFAMTALKRGWLSLFIVIHIVCLTSLWKKFGGSVISPRYKLFSLSSIFSFALMHMEFLF